MSQHKFLTVSLGFICLVPLWGYAQTRAHHDVLSPELHARIIQLEDERNLGGDELIGLLKHAAKAVRQRAALAIGRIGDKRGTDALIALIEHEEISSVRAMAAFALGEMEDVKAVPSLMALLEQGKSSLADRGRPVEALGKIAGIQANAEILGKAAIEQINQRLLEQLPDPKATLTAEKELLASLTITALMRVRSAASVEPLAQQLKSDHVAIRAYAANALARLRQPISTVVPALIDALQDGDADVRANAARALGVSKDERAVEPLLKLLPDENERVQVNAVRALAAIKNPGTVEPLIELANLINSRKPALRRPSTGFNLLLEIVSALGTIKDERALPFLVKLRGSYSPSIVREVEVAIAQFGEQKYSDLSPRLLDQPSRICSDWKQASVAAQAISAWLPTSDLKVWDRTYYVLFFQLIPKVKKAGCDQRSWPEVLRTVDKFASNAQSQPTFLQSLKSSDVKTTDSDLDFYLKFFPPQLRDKDVVVRATAATILAEQPREANLPLLIEALKQSQNDASNDARLAIINAIAKYRTTTAVEAIKSMLDDRDHLVRRHAVDLLKQMGAGDFSERIGIVQTGRSKSFYRRLVQRLDKKIVATIYTGKGVIKLELFPEDAPLTVDSFITLARKGYFNNLRFHRVVPNFVIQGGDPRGDGEGGPGYQIRCEINTRPYAQGAVGMALSGKDTGGSQFFITHSPQPHLDGGYTVFGQVTKGMAVVDLILRGDVVRKIEIIDR